MRLPRPVKARDPNRTLIAVAHRSKQQLDDTHQPAAVLAISYKCPEFAAHRFDGAFVNRGEDDFSDPLICNQIFFRINLKYVAIAHGWRPLPCPFGACYAGIGVAR